jgi:chemotaxis protein MotB
MRVRLRMIRSMKDRLHVSTRKGYLLMRNLMKASLPLAPLLAGTLVAGCVSQNKYDDLQAQYRQLQQQNSALSSQVSGDSAQISRLQGAIKYTVDSDLLFTPGGWKMSARGKQVIGAMASKLAPTQQNKIVVNGYTDNAPVGPGLMREGITSNQVLSEKRAQSVVDFLVTQGVNPSLVSAVGHADGNPIEPNTTTEGRAKNRRVELALGGG